MKFKIIPIMLASVVSLGVGPTSADSHIRTTEDLAQEKMCTACHKVTESDAMAVAPSFKTISQAYSMDESDRLIQVVLKGGEGHWGKTEMPDMAVRMDVSREEAEELVTWILKLEE
ncbi:MAG: c-type cytochrome [Marinobacter sp.]|nr:c-type cytochrome [Marinobacter sp.]